MTMLLRSLLLATCTLSGAAAHALPFTIDNAHTSAHFAVSHFERSLVRGRFDKIAGQIDFDETRRTGSVDIRIDADGIDTKSRVLNDVLKSEQFFDVEKFPDMRFQSNRFEYDGERLQALSGKLTIRGVTLPLQLTATRFLCGEVKLLVLRRNVCGGAFHATIKRSAFGMQRFLPEVGDTVEIFISIEATPSAELDK